jgi:hypothetical protein
MRHVTAELLVEYLEESIAPDNRQLVRDHLAECPACSQLKQELTELTFSLQQDAAFEPPAELVKWGVELYQPIAQPSTGEKIRRIIASLIVDTFEEPMLAGVRRAGIPPRQLVFRAGDVDVDVRIETIETNNRISMVGQVLSNTEKFLDNAPVKLESHGVIRYRTVTNLVGEFSFEELPKDTYHLSVEVPEGQITLFCVHRGEI